ncbi:hypothetical protein ACQ4PT_006208 [Festuca glaucescens]
MAMKYAFVVSLSLAVVLAVDDQIFGLEQFKEGCDKTPYPGYCLQLMKARHDDPMTYHVGTTENMAQHLMSIAAGIGHELSAMVRAERDKLPKGGAEWECMEKSAAGFDAATSSLDGVDGELLETDHDAFELAYHFVQSKRNVLAGNWKSCPDKLTSGGMAPKQKEFSMLMGIIFALASTSSNQRIITAIAVPPWFQCSFSFPCILLFFGLCCLMEYILGSLARRVTAPMR